MPLFGVTIMHEPALTCFRISVSEMVLYFKRPEFRCCAQARKICTPSQSDRQTDTVLVSLFRSLFAARIYINHRATHLRK